MAEQARMSLVSRMMPALMRLRGANKKYLSREHIRRHLEELAVRPRPQHPPKRLRKDVKISATWQQGWRTYTITPAEASPRASVIYLHGGAWIHEAATPHWKLAQQIAAEAGVSVIFPAYPLAHEAGCAETVVPYIADLYEASDNPVALMGDSSGGSIAMSTSLLLKQRGVDVPLTTLISPALDLRFGNPDIDALQPYDPWLVKKGQMEVAEMWIREHGEDPILNPFLGDLRGLGKLQIFCGTRDLLNPDARLFVERARSEGVDVDYQELDGQLHVYPLLPTPEGKRARALIVSTLARTVEVHQGVKVAGPE